MPCCCDIWQVYSRAHTLCPFSIPPCLSCRHWHWVTTQSVSALSINGTLSQYSLSWLISVLREISVLKLCYYSVISLTMGKIHIVQYNQCWDVSAALVLEYLIVTLPNNESMPSMNLANSSQFSKLSSESLYIFYVVSLSLMTISDTCIHGASPTIQASHHVFAPLRLQKMFQVDYHL